MQCCPDNIHSEGTVCWAWHTRVTPQWQWPPVCKCPLQNLPLTGTSTIAPTNPHSNGQAEAAVKIVKGLLTWSKYSGQDPYLALLASCSTPVDAHMHSPGEMLYQCALCTTVPQHIYHTDPHATADHDHLDQHASLSAANHDHQGCWQKAPLFARQSVSVLNDARCLSSMWQTMDHTLSKSSVVDNINMPMTTYVSITWMPSSLTSMPPQM